MKSRLTVFFIFAICSVLASAQNYVYSVTAGTSWAREEFHKQERLQRNLNKQQPKLGNGAPDFRRTFNNIVYAYRKHNTYNDSIFMNLSHDKWTNMFKRRARKYSDIYTSTNMEITKLKDYFESDSVPEAAYDSLYYWTRDLYHRNINDIFLYENLMGILLPHYEEKQDIEHLVFCYMCSGLLNFQCSRMGDREAEMRSELYYHKVMNLSDRFPHFRNPLNRFYFIAAFVNLSLLHTQAGNISLVESREIANNIQKMYATREVREIFRRDSLLNEFAKWSIDLFHFRGIATYISSGQNNPELRDQLYDAYIAACKKIDYKFEDLKNRYYSLLRYDDLMIEAYMGHISWDKALAQIDKLTASDPNLQFAPGSPNLKINYMNNLFETELAVLEHTTMSEKKRGVYMKNHLNRLLDIFSRYPHGQYPFEKGMILSNIATRPSILKYLTSKERRELLFSLIVVEQPTTYVHVSMVADLSKILAEGMIKNHPEFFAGIPGYPTAYDVVEKKDSLIDFVYYAAIYHDLGKINMPTIINNCYRKLTNHEFDIIQMHPEKSLPFFAIDESLKKYQDIALGHHKWFDGDGYPPKFKNRKSPYFPVICLVTVTDCMDAATENIGRNYHTPKSFETVMQEFDELSGTQFNPKLISFIMSNKDVYEKLKQHVSTGRYDNYYKLYTRYWKEKEKEK